MTDKKKPSVNFVSRDWDSIINDLVEYARRHDKNIIQEGSLASWPRDVIERVAYLGDQLSFLIDYYTNEQFPLTAVEPKNVIRHARSRGYKFVNAPSSMGIVELYAIVPAAASGGPDRRYMGVLRKGSEFASRSGNNFILLDDVNFANENNRIVVAKVNDSNGAPLSYAVRARGGVISGEIRQEIFRIGEFQPFRKIKLTTPNVSQIVSVVDAEGREYFEVDFLSQDVIFRSVLNRDATTNVLAKNILRPFPVPRRFVVEQNRGEVFLQFGHGSDSATDPAEPIDPANVALNMYGREYVSDRAFDPTNLVSSDKMGIAPSNTTLRVIVRANSTSNVNAAPGSITRVVRPVMDFKNLVDLDISVVNEVINSLEVDNETDIIGDITTPTIDELKIRMIDAYASQNRAVTAQDYISTCYSMPAGFGAIKRAAIHRDPMSHKSNLNLFVLCEDADGNLIRANGIVKSNLKTWLAKYKMINDTIDILDANIINIGIEFTIVASPNASNKAAVLTRATNRLREKYQTHFEIGQPFSITEVYQTLNKLPDVADTVDVRLIHKNGGAYTDSSYNVEKSLTADGRYAMIPLDSVFEIRFPSIDIRGAVK